MNCPGCGRDNAGDAAFCAWCGRRLACSRCGRPAPVDPSARFCVGCGARLESPAPSAPASLHGSPDLDSKAHARAGGRTDGERKQVTVLFADVRGSMDLQEDLDPEEWHGVMDRFMRILADGVHRFEGTVDKFTGDGIMALFGAPVAHEDHPCRACHAALHLIDTVGRYAEELRRTKGMNFHVRLGLNSGEVIAGVIGDDSHMEYTAVGHTVGLAQRMEALAEPGRAYLTARTASLVEGYFQLRDLGAFTVKGAREPVGVSVLEGVGPLRTAYEVARWRGLSPFVGRVEELASLDAALARAAGGAGQVVGVVGEAGVGKSRLCEEFAQSCQARGISVRRAHGVSHGRDLPLLPVVALLRQFFAITDADSPEAARAKAAGRLVLFDVLDPSSDDLPILLDFLEVPDPDRPAPRLAPEARLRRLFGILRRVIERRSERETVVILLEDLQWFDPASREFLELLVESYPGTRTLVLANFRPEFQATWMRHSYYRQLPLAALDPGAVRELLSDLLGTDPTLAELPARIVGRTGGNPFFVEEVVRALIGDGSLEGAPGVYRLNRPVDDLRVPASVQSLLSARIDRLPANEKSVLQTAAVIGRTFPEPVLRQVTNLSEEGLLGCLRALRAGEFVQEEALFPVTEYRFWHPLTQEVAYSSLLSERRLRLHAAVASAIAALEPERTDERAALLAQHWEAAGDALQAARWNARAAHRAGLRDLPEARRRWEATVRLLAGTAESAETLELGALSRTRLVRLAFRLGGQPKATETLADEAVALAERRDDPFGLIMAIYAKAFALFGLGDLETAARLLEEAARRSDELGDPDARTAQFLLVWLHSIRGPITVGLAYDDEMSALMAGPQELGVRLLGASVLPYTYHCRAWLMARAGRLEDATRAALQAAAIGRERNEPDVIAFARPVHPLVAFLSGNPDGSVGEARENVERAHDLGSPVHVVLALEGLGAAHLAAGQPEDAIRPLRDALALAREHHVGRFDESSLLAYLAEAEFRIGDTAAAAGTADAAVAVARGQGARVHECQARITRARVARAAAGRDAHEAITADLAEAAAAIEESGAAAWLPFLNEELAAMAGTGRVREEPSA